MALDDNQAAFVTGVSTQTGIDPRVIIAWDQQEGAYAPGGTGHFNYLNLRPYPGDPYTSVSGGGFEQFGTVQDAITATVRRIKMPFAAPIEQAAAQHATPRQEIAAIASTGWDAGHYGGTGGLSLQRTFAGLFPNGLDDQYESPGAASAVAATVGTGSAADAGSVDAGSVGRAAGKVADAVAAPVKLAEKAGHILDVIFSVRGLEMFGGFLLIVLGVLWLSRRGLNAALPGR